MKSENLEITINKINRVWADVTVHRDGEGKKDIHTRTKKEEVEGLPVDERISVQGEVKWETSQFGSTSELFIYTEADFENARQAEADKCMELIRKKAKDEQYLYKRMIEKIHELGVTDYDEEIEGITYDVTKRKWIGYFRQNYDNGKGYIYKRAIEELHNIGCHDYDEEFEEAKMTIREAKEAEESKYRTWGFGADEGCYYKYGQLIVHGDSVEKVISVTKQYDGWSFGYMCDIWYEVKAVDVTDTAEGRKALEEEREREAKFKAYLEEHKDEIEAREKEQRRQSNIKKAARKLREKVDKIGERFETEEAVHIKDIEGEELYNDFTIYGTGIRIKAGHEKVYVIYNNGMDGDDWSLNNIITGGAGAYAYVVNTDDISEELDALYEATKIIK